MVDSKSETKNCLSCGQAKVCMEGEGISFTVKPLLGKPYSKVIPYNSIKKVMISPRWWIFPGIRILTGEDKLLWAEPRQYNGFNFQHNQVSFYPWNYKKWKKLVAEIRAKINS